MHGEELVLGGDNNRAQAVVDEHNRLAAERREAAKLAEIARLNQVANLTGNLLLNSRRPGFVRD